MMVNDLTAKSAKYAKEDSYIEQIYHLITQNHYSKLTPVLILYYDALCNNTQINLKKYNTKIRQHPRNT
jgi:hypothetical protein